jgi:hypothetical protein
MKACSECIALRKAVMNATDIATCRRTSGEAAERALIAARHVDFFHGLQHVADALRRMRAQTVER